MNFIVYLLLTNIADVVSDGLATGVVVKLVGQFRGEKGTGLVPFVVIRSPVPPQTEGPCKIPKLTLTLKVSFHMLCSAKGCEGHNGSEQLRPQTCVRSHRNKV